MTEETMTLDLDIARKCMLLEPVGIIFDAIPMATPVDRIKIVAKGVVSAGNANENIKRMIQESGYLEALKAQAKFRSTGVVSLPPALRSTFESSPVNRETVRV